MWFCCLFVIILFRLIFPYRVYRFESLQLLSFFSFFFFLILYIFDSIFGCCYYSYDVGDQSILLEYFSIVLLSSHTSVTENTLEGILFHIRYADTNDMMTDKGICTYSLKFCCCRYCCYCHVLWSLVLCLTYCKILIWQSHQHRNILAVFPFLISLSLCWRLPILKSTDNIWTFTFCSYIYLVTI